MHFIGNRAITLGDGSPQIQINYGAGFTALSFFIPIIVLFLAFGAVGINDEVSFIRLAVGGTLAGYVQRLWPNLLMAAVLRQELPRPYCSTKTSANFGIPDSVCVACSKH